MAEQHGKTLVPQIRFAGFTDPWEQRKVGDFLSESRIKGNTGLNSRKLTVKLWGKGVIEKNDFGGSEHTQYFIRHKGQFIYSKLDFLNSAFGVIPEKLDGYESTADLPAFDLVEMNPHFMFFTAIQEGFYLKHGSAADGSRKAKRIHVNTFLEMPIMVPTVAEQDLIVEYLQSLDCLITLHQRKYDKLCVLKKSMLDKMFPKGGSLYPEIRFAGFTDPWEQRKLGEVARRVTRKNENGDSDLPLTISAQYGLVDQRTFFNSQVASKDMSGYFLLHRGEFAYNKSTSTDSPWGAIKRLEKYDMGCVSTLYICFELLSGDPDFLVTYYETDRWYKSVQLIAAEGARNHGLLNIAPDDFFETQICIPKRIDEQRRIGAFFDRLDSLITLHQRKLELLRNIKKSMLDKMFV